MAQTPCSAAVAGGRRGVAVCRRPASDADFESSLVPKGITGAGLCEDLCLWASRGPAGFWATDPIAPTLSHGAVTRRLIFAFTGSQTYVRPGLTVISSVKGPSRPGARPVNSKGPQPRAQAAPSGAPPKRWRQGKRGLVIFRHCGRRASCGKHPDSATQVAVA